MAGWMWMVVGLAALGIVGVMVLRSRAGDAGQRLVVREASGQLRPESRLPRDYSPKNVGNDASARPWEAAAIAPQFPVDAGITHAVPHGFDADAFLQSSKSNFLSLQEAWDRSDVPSLRAMMTEGMLHQIQAQLAERERTTPGASSRTEVLMLDAQLLGVEDQDQDYVASVEFSGMSREAGAAGPSPFREIWNITRPKASEGAWLVSGVQALQ